MNKMREEFEVWFKREYGCNTLTYNDGTYVMDYARRTWTSWKASRSALCVELNSIVFSRDKNGEGGLMLPERVFKAMDDAGLSYK